MKPLKYILLAFSIIISINTIAQYNDDIYDSVPKKHKNKEKRHKKNQPINSGFVFIDGKYIESPYSFKTIKGEVFINGHIIKKNKPKYKTKKVRRLPEPPASLNDSSTIDELLKVKTDDNLLYFNTCNAYFFYKYKDANVTQQKLIEYINKMPNIKSYDGYNLVAKNGEQRGFITPTWGKEEEKTNRKELKERAQISIEYARMMLEKNIVLIYKTYDYGISSTGISFDDLKVIINMLDKPKKQILDSLHIQENKYNSFKRKVYPFIDSLRNDINLQKIKTRVNTAKDKTEIFNKTNNGTEIINKSINSVNKDTKDSYGISYSPLGNSIGIGCASKYDNAFNTTYFQEKNIVLTELNKLGYDADINNIEEHTDNTFDNIADYSYSEIVNMKYNDVIYWTSHGIKSGPIDGIVLMQMKDKIPLENWVNGNGAQYINVNEISLKPNVLNNPPYNGNYPWVAIANKDWFENIWGPQLETNKSIVFLSSCYSYENSCAQACLLNSNLGDKGVAFGYMEETNGANDMEMTSYMLRMMNGSLGNGNYRTAYNAYSHIPLIKDGFSIYPSNNAGVTLCPATTAKYPNNGDIEQNTGTGYFELDTWCEKTTITNNISNTNNPLYFTTSGNVTVSNLRWDNSIYANKSNKLFFDWSGDGEITVHVNTDKIISYGGGHKLDYNGKNPNGEQNISYAFITGNGPIVTINFTANYYNILENETVDFTADIPNSTNVQSYLWDFGDGNTSTTKNPSHIYTQEGCYSVTLNVLDYNSNNYAKVKSCYINVYKLSNGNVFCSNSINGNIVNYMASYNGYTDPTYRYQYIFNFGDGYIQKFVSSLTMESITHNYGSYGTYQNNVIIKVIDQNNDTIFAEGSDCGFVQLNDPNPCANFTANITPEDALVNTPVTLDANITGGIPPYSYDWDIYDGTDWVHTTTENPQITYNSIGSFYTFVNVNESSGYGCFAQSEKYINVDNVTHCYTNLRIFDVLTGDTIHNHIFVPKDCEKYFDFSYERSNDNNCAVCSSYYNMNCNNFVPYLGYWRVKRLGYSSHIYNIGCYVQGSGANPCDYAVETCISYERQLSYEFNQLGRYSLGYKLLNKKVSPCDSLHYKYEGSKKITVDVIDCSQISTNFLNAIEYNGNFGSGTFYVDSNINNIINLVPTTLTACNKIIMENGFETGNAKFVAQTIDNSNCSSSKSFIQTKNNIINKNQDFNIYPNPFYDGFSMVFNIIKQGNINITLFDINGKQVKQIINKNFDIGDYNYDITIKNLLAGVYFCRLIQDNGLVKTIKLIKKQ